MVLKQRGNKNGQIGKKSFFSEQLYEEGDNDQNLLYRIFNIKEKMNQGKIFLAELAERIAMAMVHCINT